MISDVFAGPRLDLPLGRDASGRFLPWIIALMVYLSAMGGAGLIFLGDAIRSWDRSLAATLSLQLPSDISAARLDTTLALLRQTQGVTSAQALDQSATIALLKPWLGDTVPVDVLPLPRLIDVQIDPNATIDFAGLQQRLAVIAPEARLEDHRVWLARLHGFGRRIELVIAAIVLVIAGLTVVAVVFSASTGLAVHQQIIELLHLLGAGDRYIARQFQLQALRLGLFGGGGGALAAGATVAVIAGAIGTLDLPGPAPITIADWRLWLLLVAAAVTAGLVAMATARLTVLRRLAALP